MRLQITFILVASLLAALAPLPFAASEDKEAPEPGIVLEDGNLKFTPAKSWVRKIPKVRIIEHEFAALKAEGDMEDARLTVMGAGGSVEDNINRWLGQFTTAEGKPVKEQAKVREGKVAGQKVHFVDVVGTYKDQVGGPFAGGKVVLREDYRMLGAIVVTEKYGNYFLKFYGPKKTMDAQEKAFLECINSLQVK